MDIAISRRAIKVTTRGLQNGALTTVESGALITDSPRTPDLSAYAFPAAAK